MIKLNKLLLFVLPFYFLPSFYFKFGNGCYPYLMFIIVSACLGLLILKYKYCTNTIINLYKSTPFKYFSWLLIWIFLTGILAVFKGYYSFNRFFYVVIFGFFIRYICEFLYIQFVYNKYILIKTIIKFLSCVYFVLFIIGILEWFAALYDISFITNIICIFSNIHKLLGLDSGMYILQEARSNLPRIRSLFSEPSHFAEFITYNLPILYALAHTKYKIFSNKFINIFIKKSNPILGIICLLLTQSPIYFLFSIIVTLIYFSKHIIKFVKNNSIIIGFISIIILLCIICTLQGGALNFSKTFLHRIYNVISSFLSGSIIENIISLEPSFATRIISFYQQFMVFLKHPIFGIGFGNIGDILVKQVSGSNIPLTGEIAALLQESTGDIALNSNPFYILIYQTGLIGYIIYAMFYIKIIKELRFIKNLTFGLKRTFIEALRQSILIFFILGFIYTQLFYNYYIIFATGLACAIILNFKNKLKNLN